MCWSIILGTAMIDSLAWTGLIPKAAVEAQTYVDAAKESLIMHLFRLHVVVLAVLDLSQVNPGIPSAVRLRACVARL